MPGVTGGSWHEDPYALCHMLLASDPIGRGTIGTTVVECTTMDTAMMRWEKMIENVIELKV